jgi:flagellar biosynthesis component FlhA
VPGQFRTRLFAEAEFVEGEEVVREVLVDCKPYLACWREVEEVVERLLKEACDAHDFVERLERLAASESNVLLKTDLRILVSELRSKLKK